MRILILGSPGSGKSTLSRRLGAAAGIDPIDLDDVAAMAYRTGRRPRPLEPLLSRSDQIASTSSWIAEGVFTAWTEPLVEAATTVVVLRTSLARCLWRVVRRHFARGFRNEHGGVRRLVTFCAEIVDYHLNANPDEQWPDNPDRTTLAATMRLASTVGDRLVVLDDRGQTEAFVGAIARQAMHRDEILAQIRLDACRSGDLAAVEAALPSHGDGVHRRRLATHAAGETTYLIAWLGSQPVGHVEVRWGSTGDRSNALLLQHKPVISSLAVAESFRGRGIGSLMMSEAEQLVLRRGHEIVALAVGIDNPSARKLYRRLGCGEWPHGEVDESWPEGDGIHTERVIYLTKTLRPG